LYKDTYSVQRKETRRFGATFFGSKGERKARDGTSSRTTKGKKAKGKQRRWSKREIYQARTAMGRKDLGKRSRAWKKGGERQILSSGVDEPALIAWGQLDSRGKDGGSKKKVAHSSHVEKGSPCPLQRPRETKTKSAGLGKATARRS